MLILVVVFALAVAVQLIFFIAFIAALRRQTAVFQSRNEPASVVVCAHDEEQNLRALIPLLLEQEYDDFEIVIVNDRSNDGTFDFLREQTEIHSRLKMVNVKTTPEHVSGKKYALTLGIRAATHDRILLTDADCRPASKNWIRQMAGSFDDKTQFVLGFSPYEASPGFLNSFIRFESFVTALQYLSYALLRSPYMGVGRNLAYRKSLFLDKKGFNNIKQVMGGDDDLFVNQHANGRNTTVALHPETLVMSIPEKTWKSFFYQKIRHLSVGKLYRGRDKFRIGAFHLSWILTLFVGLPLLFIYQYYYGVAGLLILRWIVMVFSLRALLKRSGLGFNLWLVPVLDFLFPFYYISTGVVTLFTKKVRWKK